MGQVAVEVVALGHIVGGEVEGSLFFEFDVQVAALGDGHGVVERLGGVAEKFPHFVGGFKVVLIGGEAGAALVPEFGLHLQTHEDVVGFGVGLFEIVHVIGGDEGNVEPFGHVDQFAADAFFAVLAVILEFEIEVLFAVDVPELTGEFLGAVGETVGNRLGDGAALAAGGGNEAAAVFGEELHVHPGLVVEAFKMGEGAEAGKVVIALHIGGQQQQVVHGGGLARLVVTVGTGVDLAADNGIDVFGAAGVEKIDGAVHDPVIGEPQGRHPQLRGLFHGLFDLNRGVKQRVTGVNVEVDEGFVRGHASFHARRRKGNQPRIDGYRQGAVVKAGFGCI